MASKNPDGSWLVTIDNRKRAPLAGLGDLHRYYKAHQEPDGTIILEPAVVVPVREVPGA